MRQVMTAVNRQLNNLPPFINTTQATVNIQYHTYALSKICTLLRGKNPSTRCKLPNQRVHRSRSREPHKLKTMYITKCRQLPNKEHCLLNVTGKVNNFRKKQKGYIKQI